MKIIKDGDLNRLKRIRRFSCDTCGCLFEADKDEYEADTQYNETFYLCNCPCCGSKAKESKNTSWANMRDV